MDLESAAGYTAVDVLDVSGEMMSEKQPAESPGQPHPERRYLSPLQVARTLGVSETTVKRWVDEGRLPAQRTPGGHRRILASDVRATAQRENWPVADPA